MKPRSLLSWSLALLFLGGCSLWPVEKRLLSDKEFIRTHALKGASQWAPRTRERVVSAMLAALPNPNDRIVQRARQALVTIGPPAVPAVTESLSSQDPFVRTLAVTVLSDIGSPVSDIQSALMGALKDPHPLVRAEAAHGLGGLGLDGPALVTVLTNALKDPDPGVQEAAQDALNRMDGKKLKTS